MKKLFYLICGLIGFYLFSVVFLKSLNESKFFSPIQKVVKEKKINTSAFFYSDNLFIDTLDTDVTIRHLTKSKEQ